MSTKVFKVERVGNVEGADPPTQTADRTEAHGSGLPESTVCNVNN